MTDSQKLDELVALVRRRPGLRKAQLCDALDIDDEPLTQLLAIAQLEGQIYSKSTEARNGLMLPEYHAAGLPGWQPAGSSVVEQAPPVISTEVPAPQSTEAASQPEDFTSGSFRPVIGDGMADKSKVENLLLVSGRLTWDLMVERGKRGLEETAAIARTEQLYPWPIEELRAETASYPNLKQVKWVQDEPLNQGPWPTFALNIAPELGRPVEVIARSASTTTAVGTSKRHLTEQKDLLDSLFSISLPTAITAPPGEGGTVNLFAAGLVLAVMCLLIAGVRESTRANTVLVITKLTILAFFIVIGITHFTGGHFKPFAPHGTSGTVDAAALIFFAYIGFDAVSTTGEEADNPQRDLPIGIIGSLVVVTIVYILVAVAAIGLVPSNVLSGADAPLTEAIRQGAGLGSWAGDIMSLGALIAITSVVLTIYYGQTRIFFSMCRDGLVPGGGWLSRLSPRHVPVRITVGFGVLIAIMAALIPLSELAELVNIGTLFAFFLVNAGVIVLRRLEPDMERPFRVPFVPLFPLIGMALCVYLMTKLQGTTWWRFGIWLAIGLAIYAFYGRFHSRVHRDADPEPEPAA